MVGEHQRPLQDSLQASKKWLWWWLQGKEDNHMEVLWWDVIYAEIRVLKAVSKFKKNIMQNLVYM